MSVVRIVSILLLITISHLLPAQEFKVLGEYKGFTFKKMFERTYASTDAEIIGVFNSKGILTDSIEMNVGESGNTPNPCFREYTDFSYNFDSKNGLVATIKGELYDCGAKREDGMTDQQYKIYLESIEDPRFIPSKTVNSMNYVLYGINGSGKFNAYEEIQRTTKLEEVVVWGDLERLDKISKKQLRILRNTIFAKYGRKFNSEDLRDYFLKKDWYKPQFEDVSSKITKADKEIIDYILVLESR